MRHLTPIERIADEASYELQSDRPTRHRRSRRSAWRDGLAAQTVIEKLENVRSYRAFERAIIASVEPRSVIELELGHRLASLLWRLRRASAIETGLFEIQGEFLLACRHESLCGSPPAPGPALGHANGHRNVSSSISNGPQVTEDGSQEPLSMSTRPRLSPLSNPRAIAQCLRISNLDPALLDRVGAYESRLWRQAAQTIWILEAMRQPPPVARRSFRKAIPHFFREQDR
jgi:hypothetical protein